MLAVVLLTAGLLGMHVMVDHGHGASMAMAGESCHHDVDCVPAPAAPAPAPPAVVVLSRSDAAQAARRPRSVTAPPARAPAPRLVDLSISRT